MRGSALRVDRSATVLQRLRRDVDDWEKAVKRLDPEKQYATQLAQLLDVVHGILARVRCDLDAVNPLDGASDVYAACRDIDRQLTFARRYWRWFADKFDQRAKGAPFAAVVRAADEVVWSLYATAFPKAESRGAVPLPFVDPEFAPFTTPRSSPPAGLRLKDERDALLAELLTELPIPVIGVPPVCADEPWMLVLLGHEVGHQIALEAGLTAPFGATVAAALSAAGAGELVTAWAGWDEELIADCLGVLSTGPGIVWALAEVERTTDEAIVEPIGSYPPAVIRWAAMTALTVAGGGKVPASIRPLGELAATAPVGSSAAEHARGVGPITRRLGTGGSGLPRELRQRSGFSPGEHGAGGAIIGWRDKMTRLTPITDETSRDTPRHLIAGAVPAWLAEATASQDLTATRETLAAWLLGQLIRCHEPGERAEVSPPAFDAGAAAGRIVDRLHRATSGELA